MISQLPNYPDEAIDSESEFNTKAFVWTAHMRDVFQPEMNAEITSIDKISSDASKSAQSASEDAALSAQSALVAQSNANFSGVWASGTNYSTGQSVLEDDTIYLALQASKGKSPSTTNGYWRINSSLGAVGNAQDTLCDLPLRVDGDMLKGKGSTTFTRASEGTYIDIYGILQTAVADEMRFQKGGYLNEDVSENSILQSNFVGDNSKHANWNLNNATGTFTETSPDGTANASEITVVLSGTAARARADSVVIPVNKTLTYSIFLKAGTAPFVNIRIKTDSGGGSEYDNNSISVNMSTFEITNNGSNVISSTAEALSNGWYRVSAVIDASLNTLSSTIMYLNLCSGNNNENPNAGDTALMYGAMIEPCSLLNTPFDNRASSYISTADITKTRDKDYFIADGNSNVPSTTEGTIIFDFILHSAMVNQYYSDLVVISQGSQNNLRIFIQADGTLYVRGEENGSKKADISICTVEHGKNYRVAISWKNEVLATYVNGIYMKSKSYTDALYGYDGTTGIEIGGNATGANASIKAFKTYSEGLDAQTIALA